jgi:hypothetical protein
VLCLCHLLLKTLSHGTEVAGISLLKHALYFCELTEISEIFDQILLHTGDIKQVRWLSNKEREVKAMLF